MWEPTEGPWKGREEVKGYSNYDREMPDGIEAALQSGKSWAPHFAFEHFGRIWFENGQFHEYVMRHGSHMETISAETMMGLIEKVNDEWGHD